MPFHQNRYFLTSLPPKKQKKLRVKTVAEIFVKEE